MPISAIRNIETAWAPYTLMFSRDGSRLAVGGGSWYGNGGIVMHRLDRMESAALRWKEVPWVTVRDIGSLTTIPSGVPTVSGVCFSDDDRYLAASMWSSGQHDAPTM